MVGGGAADMVEPGYNQPVCASSLDMWIWYFTVTHHVTLLRELVNTVNWTHTDFMAALWVRAALSIDGTKMVGSPK